MRGQHPAPGASTKALQESGQATVMPVTVLGVNVYITAVNSSAPLYLQPGGPVGYGNTTYTTVTTGTAQPPTTNLATVQPPNAAPGVTAVAGAGPTAGTYDVAYTIVTSKGETTISPATTITVNGAQSIQFFSGIHAGGTAPTGQAIVTVMVPRLEDWHVTRYAVFTTTSVSEPTVELYVDTISLVSLLDSSDLGGRNSGNADIYLRPGQSLIAVWTGADLSSTATLCVFGEKTS